jgi:uncharacterized Zn finger protein
MGWDHLPPRATPIAIDSFEPPVPRAVKLEGTGFYLHGRVGVILAEAGRVRAVVRGARPFDVSIVVGAAGNAAVSCDCATFREQREICRHVWAALIKTQNDELLPAPTPSAAAR